MSCAWRLPFHSATVSVCSETRRQELVSGMWREAPPSALCCQPRVVEGGGVALAHGCWPSGVHEDSSEGLLQPAVPSKCDRRFLIDFEQRCCFSFHLLFLYLLDNLFLKMHISMKTASGNSYVLNPWSKKKKKKNLQKPPNSLRLYGFKGDRYRKEGMHFSDYFCFVFTSLPFSKSIDCVSVT